MHSKCLEADFSATEASLFKQASYLHCFLGSGLLRISSFTPRYTEEMVVNVSTLANPLPCTRLLSNGLSYSIKTSASTPLMKDKLRAMSEMLCFNQNNFAGAVDSFASVEG
jgi:hypothetical protein